MHIEKIEKNSPAISIIVPVYNVEKYIERCIESILSQTLKDWELILVDDCGTDKSMDIVRKYTLKDDRIKCIESSKNQGPMVAREKGCQLASGEYITFCDGDDTLPSSSLQLFYEAANKENADVVVGQFARIINEHKIDSFPIKAKLLYGNNNVGFLRSILRYEMPQGVCGKCFKNNIVKQNLKVIENATMGEDAGVLFQYVERIHNAVVLEEVVYNYYQNSSSSTHTTIPKKSLAGLCELALIREEVVSKYDELDSDFNRYIINNFISLYPAYKKGGVLDYYLEKTGLSRYLTIKNIVKHYNISQSIKYLFVRDVMPVVYPLYNKLMRK